MAEGFPLERIVPVAAELWRQLAPETKSALDRVFKRDVTVCDWQTSTVLEAMGVEARRFSKEPHLPGCVVIVSDKDQPGEEVVAGFLARGGTVIVEGDAIDAMSEVCGCKTKAAPALPPGAVRVKGRLVETLPKALAPLYWADGDARTVRLVPAKNAEVLLATEDGTPVAQRMETRGGSLVHVACSVGVFRLGKDESKSKRASPKALAKLAGVSATGALTSDEPMPEQAARAALTMMTVLGQIIADASRAG